MLGRIARALGRRNRPAPDDAARHAQAARALVVRADAARDARAYAEAARLYAEASRLCPDDAAIHIQRGHMLKEAGDLAGAEARYLEATRLTPEDADLALQLGHLHKVAGRVEASESAYGRALALRPGWAEPARELAFLHRRYGRRSANGPLEPGSRDADRLAPELLPRRPAAEDAPEGEELPPEGVQVLRLGSRLERSRWGTMNTLRGVEAVRGACVSAAPLRELQVVLDGRVVHRETLRAAADDPRRHGFNAWFDVSSLAPGPYEAELRFVGDAGELRVHREPVVVLPPLLEAEHPDSDAVVELGAGSGTVEARVNARPSMVRPARRGWPGALAGQPVRSVLVVRADQLGDLVVSVPGLRRLREILPDARLVGLLTPGNAELAATLGLFDELVVTDFPLDEREERRVMPLAAQEALRARLAPYAFDLAIDLAENHDSRPLLLLSGARALYGAHDADFPWLDAGFEAGSHDRKTGAEAAPQSGKVLAMVERLATLLDSRAQVVRRPELTRAPLAAYGLEGSERYAVVHTGTRITATRWPHYGELVALLLRETDLAVVLLADTPGERPALAPDVAADPRLRCPQARPSFDQLDALVSFCALFVGNDSGPKHLAALRGARVVSLHSGRIGWREWGQEIAGRIISRRVPCAGCGITRAEACGKDLACLARIAPAEVLGAAAMLLREA